METTFITIHDLTPSARILYCSDSIVDILGYQPNEVINRPCWDFFHPDEIPLAQARFGKGVEMDKAAVLSYCRMRNRDHEWLGCEVVFTIVHDVMVGCTSTYRRGMRSATRAAEAPVVRRLFSSSPRDPRYHMLSHLSSKFSLSAKPNMNEPRAALFLNRYTRTLTIMYATNGLQGVLGMTGDELRGRSFYYCIQEDCLQDAIRCLENAKANDSIAYMRFKFRDPRYDGDLPADVQAHPGDNAVQSSDDDRDHEMGGVPLTADRHNHTHSGSSTETQQPSSDDSSPEMSSRGLRNPPGYPRESSGGESSNPSNPAVTHDAIFGESAQGTTSSTSLSDASPAPGARGNRDSGSRRPAGPSREIELEAVVSCTSDGLVVCLRKARPFPPDFVQRTAFAARQAYFAVPWSNDSLLDGQSHSLDQYSPHRATPEYNYQHQSPFAPGPRPVNAVDSSDTAYDDFMTSIRDCAVFAWALAGINGTIAQYGHGKPHGEAQPPAGLPIWDPSANQVEDSSILDQKPVNQLSSRSIANAPHAGSTRDPFGDPGLNARPGNSVERAAPAYAAGAEMEGIETEGIRSGPEGTLPISRPPPQLPWPGS